MECQFCKRKLKTPASLKSHQKTAKYCLKLRGETKRGSHICRFCNKDFFKKGHLRDHIDICESGSSEVVKLKEKIEELKLTISMFENRVKTLEKDKKDLLEHSETIAKQPRYTQNNRINITQNLAIFNKTDEDIERIVHENYNKEHLIEGQKGAARFTNENIIQQQPGSKPIYVVTDKTRGHGKYRVSNNETVIDNGMVGLSEKVIPSMRKKAAVIYRDDFDNDEVQNGYNDLIQDDVTDFRSEMVRLQECTSLYSQTGVVTQVIENLSSI
jgi:hypothetical protein